MVLTSTCFPWDITKYSRSSTRNLAFSSFLAPCCTFQGDYKAAESIHERSLAIREQTLGIDHPDVARSLGNLAAMLEEQVGASRPPGLGYAAAALAHFCTTLLHWSCSYGYNADARQPSTTAQNPSALVEKAKACCYGPHKTQDMPGHRFGGA